MARSAAYRKYQLTINNPLEKGFTHDVLKATLGSFSGCLYWCMCDEVGEQQTLHTHVYAAFKNAVEFAAMQQRFYGVHIESARGTHHENRAYIRKDGSKFNKDASGHYHYTDSSGKHHTGINYTPTFEESGDLPEESGKRESQSQQVLSMIEGGAGNADIIRTFPTWGRSLHSLDDMRQTLLEERFRDEFRNLDVWYLWGPTGVGKTRYVMDTYGYGNVYRVTNYAHPFDGYRGQDVILFDEFRGDLPAKDMLKYLEGYPLMLPCRYGDKVACYTKAFVVSNIPFERQYPNVQIAESETFLAFRRRFTSGGIIKLPEGFDDMPF